MTAVNDPGSPALTRGLAVLRVLSAHPEGAAVADLARAGDIPRATLYRLLRTLVVEGFAQPAPEGRGRYVLGPALARISGAAQNGRNLVQVARPIMEALAAEIGETVKLVVRDGSAALTVAVSIPRRDGCIASKVGTRLLLHVGGSQRLLLAHAPAAVRERILAGPLERVTSRTITNRRALRADLAALALRRDVASHGEGVDGVGATTALVGATGSEPLAALVAVYVYASQNLRRLQAIRKATRTAADRILSALG